MSHRDGNGGARARSARIRSAHDHEATQLDSMRRRSAEIAVERAQRVSLVARVRTAIGRAGRERIVAPGSAAREARR